MLIIKLEISIKYGVLADDNGSEKIIVELEAKVIHKDLASILSLENNLGKKENINNLKG